MAVLSEDQALLKDMAGAWVRERAPIAATRRVRERNPALGYDPGLYAEMGELGWTGMLASETYGGSAFGCFGS